MEPREESALVVWLQWFLIGLVIALLLGAFFGIVVLLAVGWRA